MKKIDPIRFLKPGISKFKPYSPSQTLGQISKGIGLPIEEIVKLDTSENPYVDYLQDKTILQKIRFSSYPDPLCIDFREKLAKYTGVSKDWILCGNGSDELIDLLIRAFISPKDEIIVNPPTFPMYEFCAQLSEGKTKKVTRKKDFSLNIEEIIKKISPKTKIIFIDSPGNPTGVITPKEEFEKLLSQNCIIVADEAYFEYCNKTVIPLLKRYPNLIILRTLSKWAGLAGLRIGYLLANPKIIKILTAIKSPYNVNSAAQILGCFVLDNKEEFLNKLRTIISFRDMLWKALSSFLELTVFPSQGAYIVFKPKQDSEKLYAFLKKNGIIIKPINQPLLKNSFRVRLGEQKEIERLANVVKNFYNS